ncbi:MAG: UrcA family protein [Sphingomicrobium sp.]
MNVLVMLAAVATSALLLVPTVASAQTEASASVSVGRLDLTVNGSQNKLNARIARGIGQMCTESGMRGADRRAMEDYCFASAHASVASIRLASNAKSRSYRG